VLCSVSGKERQFLRDFVSASEETSGGRLARWLQPESVVDPSKSQLIFPGVFSASLATFGVPNSTSLGTIGFGSPIKSVTNDKGIFVYQLLLTNPYILNFISLKRKMLYYFLDEEDEETPSEATTVTSTTTTVVSEGLRAGWPAILTLLTRDQYGHLVHVPNLKV
jgi:E3 ubiquitin-protein ligase MYCBP2